MTDEQRDAHLREALRHAPDAQVQPPPALSALILSEARAKARDAAAPARPPTRHPLAVVWGWLARPSVAAGFAGVMAATLVGLMWWDQPMDEALPRRPAPATAPAPVAATPPVAPTPAAAPPLAPPPAPLAEAARPAPEPPRLALRKSAPMADKAVVAATAPPPVPSMRDEAATASVDAKAGAAQTMREAAPPAMPAPVATPAPALAAAPAANGMAAAPAGAVAKSKAADEAPPMQRSLATDAMRAKAAPKAELNESRKRQEVEARPSIASLRAAIAAEPARWAWQRGGGAAQDVSDAVYAWLAQLDSATGAAWQPRAAREAAAPLGRELRLLRDGRVLHSLQLTERGVLWEREQSSWQAELPLLTLQALDSTAP